MRIVASSDLTVFGEGSFREYRIPGIVRHGSVLLAYFECRGDGGDWADIRVGLRRSTDGGLSWEPLRVIASPSRIVREDGRCTVGNPCMISDGDKLHFFYCVDYRRLYHAVSDDGGLTFGPARDITPALEKEDYPPTVVAAGPGHGIRLPGGRLFLPVWMARNEGDPFAHHPSVTSAVISDDGGLTFRRTALIEPYDGFTDPNESCAASLEDGRLLLNLRSTSPARRRALAFSEDGGERFTRPVFAETLKDPVCCAGMCAGGDGYVYFTNCASDLREGDTRIDLTLFRSRDGLDWEPLGVIEEKAGYSDLCSLGGGRLAVFYEAGRPAGVTAAYPQKHLRVKLIQL